MSGPIEVVLLIQQHCSLCDHAKQVLERLAVDYPLEITTLGLATPEGRTLAERAGIVFPPVVILDGEPFSYGRLSQRKLRRELDRRLHATSP